MTNAYISKYLGSFIALIYPRLCLVCKSSLVNNEGIICTHCRQSLPETNFHKSPGNPVEQLFWGRLPVTHATALLYFDKGSSYRQLIHQLKYQGRTDAGIFLGNLLGSAIERSDFTQIDCIIPIPLHRIKLRRRGFNQSEVIAEAIGDVLGIKVLKDVLHRNIYTHTQTRRKRYDRWKNVEGIFECTRPEKIENKHVLIVDDVITTGSTIEAAGSALCEGNDLKLSVASAAFSHI